MNKEELEKEADEYTSNLLKDVNCTLGNPRARQINSIDIQDAYLAGAEPREKQIQIDVEQIRALQKQNGELTDRVKELEAEIDRLKGDLELWESGACRATNLDKCGVIKELKAQIEKMKWHDLRKDSNDLPFEEGREFEKGKLTKAKDHIKKLLDCLKQDTNDPQTNYYVCQYMDKAEQFLKE